LYASGVANALATDLLGLAPPLRSRASARRKLSPPASARYARIQRARQYLATRFAGSLATRLGSCRLRRPRTGATASLACLGATEAARRRPPRGRPHGRIAPNHELHRARQYLATRFAGSLATRLGSCRLRPPRTGANAARCRHPFGTRETAWRSPNCGLRCNARFRSSKAQAKSRVRFGVRHAVSAHCVRVPQVGRCRQEPRRVLGARKSLPAVASAKAGRSLRDTASREWLACRSTDSGPSSRSTRCQELTRPDGPRASAARWKQLAAGRLCVASKPH
jgi:hypothetical protein